MRRKFGRIGVAALSLIMAFNMAACGDKTEGDNKDGGKPDAQQAQQMQELINPDYIYVPTYKDVTELGEDVNFYNALMKGDYIYFVQYDWNEETMESSQALCKYSLVDGSVSKTTIQLEDSNMGAFDIDAEGNIIILAEKWDWDEVTEYSESSFCLMKISAAGEVVLNVDINDTMKSNQVDYANYLCVDDKGRIYILSQTACLLFDTDGKFAGTVAMGSDMDTYCNGMGQGLDGKVYAASQTYSAGNSESKLCEIDFDSKSVKNSYSHFSTNGNTLVPLSETSWLINDGSFVSEYDCTTQTSKRLFNWLDSDLNGQYVTSVAALSNGKIVACYEDWENDDRSIVEMTKTPSSEVVQKEVIVLGSLYSDSRMTAAAVKFNKSNSQYRVVIKNYIDPNADWNENTWSDAMTAMNNDIISGSCPDVIDIGDMNVQQLASKGVFADMGAFLDKSNKVKREDYFESILNACTYNNILVGIPKTFSLSTVAGSAEDLGNRSGWTLQEMMEYGKKNPGKQLFHGLNKEYALYLCMMNNEASFVDWSTGECHFNTDDFKAVLEFVNAFPDDYEYDEVSDATLIEKGQVLLTPVNLYDFQEIQMYDYMFKNNACFIGFPTVDGKHGSSLMPDTVYAISERSSNKEGAWAFVESYLAEDTTSRWSWGLPANKKHFERAAEDACKVEYVTDENGEVVLDENGEPYVMGGGGSIGFEDGWTYEYHVPTKEEVDQLKALIDNAGLQVSQNDTIMEMITEEAQAYFKGQKSADDVAKIIQNRVQVYVDENQ